VKHSDSTVSLSVQEVMMTFVLSTVIEPFARYVVFEDAFMAKYPHHHIYPWPHSSDWSDSDIKVVYLEEPTFF